MTQSNISLKPFNTFGIDVSCDHFSTFSSIEELETLLKEHNNRKRLILGGGSNMLFTKDFDGAVLKNEIKGITVSAETDDTIDLTVGAGEVWHDFVLYCVDHNFGGVENLSLIPGTVGASPMQNIGAYGVEIKDIFVRLEAVEIASGEVRTFTNEECHFGYRESIFKNTYKDRYVIVNVTYRLTKKNHELKTAYGAIQEELQRMQVSAPSIKDISNAVIAIRQSKLPDPKQIGNAGSFFKNPVVDISVYNKIAKEYENVPHYPAGEGKVKLAAGWLIEKAGWKGYRKDNYGVHEKQALVLVNLGNTDGKKIYNLSKAIIEDLNTKFGVVLEREVNII